MRTIVSDQLCSGMQKAFTLENKNMWHIALIVKKKVQFKQNNYVGVRYLDVIWEL